MRRLICVLLAGFGWLAGGMTQASEQLYENNFEKAAVGATPDDFLVLDGSFTVQQDGTNKVLELPGAPLDTFGALFGPTEREAVSVTARIFGTAKGRRSPTFGVGLNGGGGYKLQLSPAKKLIELYRGDFVKTTIPYEWESGKWTHLELQVEKPNPATWKVTGKVWRADQSTPALISFEDKEEPPSGKAAIWASPFSGTPIRFDDLAVSRTSSMPNQQPK